MNIFDDSGPRDLGPRYHPGFDDDPPRGRASYPESDWPADDDCDPEEEEGDDYDGPHVPFLPAEPAEAWDDPRFTPFWRTRNMSSHNFHPPADGNGGHVSIVPAAKAYEYTHKGCDSDGGCLKINFGDADIALHSLTTEQIMEFGRRIEKAGQELADRMTIEANRIADTAAFAALNADRPIEATAGV